MNIDRYKELLNSNDFNEVSISPQIPFVTKNQYKRGYIERSFIQKSNDTSSNIFEVSNDDVGSYSQNPFYISVTLDWRLIGDPIDVKKSNSESLRIASKTIPKIALYLPNLLQFHKK
jgi:hypothetical protein